MHVQLLIDAILQQSTVFVAQLATAGGARAPLAHMVDQVFMDLNRELQSQGVRKKLIADMFGMTLRTYHRRVRELSRSATYADRTVWEAVLDYIRKHEPVTRARLRERFLHDDHEVVVGVLTDLVNTGLCYATGQGDGTIYRVANEADFLSAESDQRKAAHEHLVWLHVYRNGPLSLEAIASGTSIKEANVATALESLTESQKVRVAEGSEGPTYVSERFDVPVGDTNGWEAAVLDHYQAVVTAIISKLRRGRDSKADSVAGGATYSLDVWQGHPMRDEALQLLGNVRKEVDALRDRIDAHNLSVEQTQPLEQVIFYAGQFLKNDD